MGARVAALYDVHGNLPALEAVLAQIETNAVDLVVFSGDLRWGPWPSETLSRAQALGERALFLHGNCETLVSSTREASAPQRFDPLRGGLCVDRT